jgi:pyruvate/2-oxoglutarate dehydrogenase complex dihydrolipoamide acyltransferase (E2) component
MHPVHIPQEQVNDETVLLVDWLVANGKEVKAGQPIAIIETSKSTSQVSAPQDGYLRHAATLGTEVGVGSVFCHIASSPEEILVPETPVIGTPSENSSQPAQTVAAPQPEAKPSPPEPITATPAASGTSDAAQRFSRRALELIEKHGLSKTLFQDKAMVRESDVQALLDGSGMTSSGTMEAHRVAPQSSSNVGQVGAFGVPLRTEELPRMKRMEGKYLSSAFRNTLTSVVTVICPTSGLKAAVGRKSELGGSISALVLFETARLLRKYPVLNAFHDQGKVHFYEEVNIGLAMDGGHGLKVPVIAQCDKKGVLDIAREVEDLVLAYLDDKIPVAKLGGGTFTITDLSSEDVISFHPLINQGQAAILGVGAEFHPPGSREGFFHLILAFDHQLTEGRTAARFLKDLRDRVRSYEGALNPGKSALTRPIACSHCARSVEVLEALNEPLLETVRSSGEKTLICRQCLLSANV